MNDKPESPLPRRGEYQARVLEQREFGRGHKCLYLELTVLGAKVYENSSAGQFVQIACRDLTDPRCPTPLLRRPFSLAGLEVTGSDPVIRTVITIIYRIIGPGTEWLRRRSAGDLVNLLGPLGNGFTLPADASQRTILIGGGVGLPPMFFLDNQLARAGIADRLALAGARTAGHIEGVLDRKAIDSSDVLAPTPALEQFRQNGTNCIIATEDGTCGYHGNVIAALDQYLEQHSEWQNARLFGCGPDGMLKALAELALRRNMACQVCMEAYMACGIGVCQSCVVPVRSQNSTPTAAESRKYKLVCANGPVFDSNTIIWD